MKTLLCDSDFQEAIVNATELGHSVGQCRADVSFGRGDLARTNRDQFAIASDQVMAVVASLGLRWGECGENPAVFCYRIGMDLLAPFCGHAPVQGDAR